jgi:hypothetical protein
MPVAAESYTYVPLRELKASTGVAFAYGIVSDMKAPMRTRGSGAFVPPTAQRPRTLLTLSKTTALCSS